MKSWIGCLCSRIIALALGISLTGSSVVFAVTDAVKALDRVVVTGSLIPTAELVTPTPVDVYTGADIAKFGSQSVRQFLSTLPASIGSGNFGETRGNGGDGSAAVSIRGIDGGTLVLINGRRLASNQLFGSGNVDVNVIPIGMVERIEVLKDGASALYGADAQAGVVNIITKKNFTGTEMYASYGNTTETDVGQQNYYFVTGLAGEKTSVMVGGNYYKANALFSFDRDRSSVDLSDRTSVEWLRNTSGTGNPGRLRTTEPNMIIPPAGLVFGTAPRGLPGEPARGTTPSVPFDPSEFHTFSSADRFPFPIYTPAIRPSERWSIFGEGTHELMGKHLEFFTEGLYSRTLSFNQLAPTPIVFFGLTPLNAPDGIVIPADNPYNPFGVDMDLVQYRAVELGPRTENITSDFFRFVSGFRGQVADTDWHWEAAGSYSEDSRLSKLGGELSALALAEAVRRTDALAFNPFGREANSPEQLDLVRQTLFQASKSTLAGADLIVRGPLFELPGGRLEMAVGAGRFEERAEFEVDNSTRTGDTVGFNQANPFSARRNVNHIFGELRIPITGKDMEIPVLHTLELTLAGRIDEYSDFGTTENPKITVKWQPFEEPFVLRGSWGTSFIAPSFASLKFRGQSFPELLNPFSGAFEQPVGGTTLLGNPDLKPEEGETWTGGFVWNPSFIKGLTIGVDYYRIKIEDRISNNTQFIIDENFRTGGNDPANPIVNGAFAELIDFVVPVPGDPFNANSPLQYLNVDSPFLNLGAVKTEGIDMLVNYELPTDTMGTFTFNANATYVFKFDRQTLPGESFDDVLGDFIPDEVDAFGFGTIPRWRANVSGFWNFKNFEFGTTVRYIHHVRDYNLVLDSPREVSSAVYVDLQASYLFPYDTKVTVGVLNVADSEPPKAVGAFADNYDRDLHDLRQRFVYFSILKKF